MARGQFKQGIFRPLNPEKVVGSKAIRFLSSYELKFMRFADKNPNVVKWGSENIIVPYVSPIDRKVHRYLVDNFILLKTNNGLMKYLIEIKPIKQTLPPSTKNRKKKSTLIYEQVMYAVNQAKWAAAKAYAEKHGFKFLILSEEHLNIKTTR